MKKAISVCLIVVGLMAWLVGSADIMRIDQDRLEELLATHEAVSVTAEEGSVYITLVKGTKVTGCKISPVSRSTNKAAPYPTYAILCEPLSAPNYSSRR